MLKHYKVLSLCAAVAMTAVSLLAVTPALAKSEPMVVTAQRTADLPTQRVSFRDLNLASADDQVKLERRVGGAVKGVCQYRDQQAQRTLSSYSDYRECSDFAWDGARPQIAAAIDRAQALASLGGGSLATASLTITVAAPRAR